MIEFAPGMRTIIRDEEWMIKKIETNGLGNISELESIASEKCLLYVAMTRAQKGVYITSYGRRSEFLGKVMTSE